MKFHGFSSVQAYTACFHTLRDGNAWSYTVKSFLRTGKSDFSVPDRFRRCVTDAFVGTPYEGCGDPHSDISMNPPDRIILLITSLPLNDTACDAWNAFDESCSRLFADGLQDEYKDLLNHWGYTEESVLVEWAPPALAQELRAMGHSTFTTVEGTYERRRKILLDLDTDEERELLLSKPMTYFCACDEDIIKYIKEEMAEAKSQLHSQNQCA